MFHPNIDVVPGVRVDIVCDLEREQIPFHDNHATKIKAIHSLQHMSRDGMRHVLNECYRILNLGGEFFAMLGDLDFILERLREDGLYDGWLSCLFHGPAIEEPLGYHRWAYTFDMIAGELREVGFRDIQHCGFYNRWEFKVLAVKR